MVAALNKLTPVEDDLRRHLFGAERSASPRSFAASCKTFRTDAASTVPTSWWRRPTSTTSCRGAAGPTTPSRTWCSPTQHAMATSRIGYRARDHSVAGRFASTRKPATSAPRRWRLAGSRAAPARLPSPVRQGDRARPPPRRDLWPPAKSGGLLHTSLRADFLMGNLRQSQKLVPDGAGRSTATYRYCLRTRPVSRRPCRHRVSPAASSPSVHDGPHRSRGTQ